MSPRTFIEMTYQPDAWNGDIHQCEGWIARWEWGDQTYAGWAKNRKVSYNKALRAITRARRDEARKQVNSRTINALVMNITMTIDMAVARGLPRKIAIAFAKEACK